MKTNITMIRCDGRNLRRQSVVGLLLLTLLAANPFQASGQGVIDTSSTTGANLDSLFLPPTNTVTVNSGVTIDNTTSGNYAVSGSSQPWFLTNSATASLLGNVNGVNFGAGSVVNAGTITGAGSDGVYINDGNVENQTDGIISGGSVGVYVGDTGFVSNAGTITGTNRDGIYIENDGYVDNQQTGIITGSLNGTHINFPGWVTNAGSITGLGNDGINVWSGYVTNTATGTITGANDGVHMLFGSGTVDNAGTITGNNNDGILLSGEGSVDNLTTNAVIAGNNNGVEITGGVGTVDNAGTIIGTNNYGVSLTSGGSVNNQRGGSISGGSQGVYIAGGSVDNAGSIVGNNDGVIGSANVNNQTGGTITGLNWNGVELYGGNVTNMSGGAIMGHLYGVDLIFSGIVDNAGTITANSYAGVHLGSGGSVNNLTTNALIAGSVNGVDIVGGAGTVDNAGTITGTNYAGVYISPGSGVTNSVNNQAGGTIQGGRYGVQLYGASTVDNAGTITGNNDDGVYIDSAGSGVTDIVNNQSGGIITGGRYGVEIFGDTGSVENRGTISGENGDGVRLSNGGMVDNHWSGLIAGNNNGVYITGDTGTVINRGTIIGTNHTGVDLQQGGSVDNHWNGIIVGGGYGVEISGGAGYVTNRGTISGENNNGVRLWNGGTVENHWSGIIGGNNDGVKITGDDGTVINNGLIVGTNANGVYFRHGSSVENESDGTIQGGQYGIFSDGLNGSIVNAGMIIGINTNGIYFSDSESFATVENQENATIRGGQYGIYLEGDGTVVNAGTITGLSEDGIYIEDQLNNPDWVYNQEGGIIQGANNGVYIDYPGAVTNAGTISGANGDGVRIDNGDEGSSAVVNRNGGNIAGNENGVEINSGPGLVKNGGLIVGTNRDGVYMDSGGSVINHRSGSIVGGAGAGGDGDSETIAPAISVSGGYGVEITGDSGYVRNRGSITGDHAGVRYDSGGTVDNRRHGYIYGNHYGIEISGPSDEAYVNNSGEIWGENHDGVRLYDGGTVNNYRHGSIEGGYRGVHISGGTGIIYNAGTITGDSGLAIQLDDYSGNTVTLDTHSQVNGNILGGDNDDAAYLWGRGQYGDYIYGFSDFATLTVQADSARWNQQQRSWDLTGTNSFSSRADVQSGLLRINGVLNTPLLVVHNSWAGGSLGSPILTNSSILASDTSGLGGSGVINGAVNAQGYISPGNSIGTLTINGSLTSSGNYYAEVTNSGASDRILVTGQAAINGGYVIVEPTHPTFNTNSGNAGFYAVQTTFTIVTGTNVTGAGYVGSTVVTNNLPQSALFPLSGSSLLYDLNNVYLVLNRTPFTSVAQTFNQNSVAGALDGVGVAGLSPTMANLVNQFYGLPTSSAAQAALDSMSGEIHGTLGMLDVQQQGVFNNTIAQRTGRISAGGKSGEFATSWKPVQLASAGSTLPPMQQAQVNQPLDMWVQGIGSFGDLDGDGNAQGGNYTIGGLGGGLDYRVTPELLLGLGLGYSHDNADVGGPGANGTVDAYQVAGYGGYVKGPWHLDGILSYGCLQTDTKRFINVGTIHQQANGSYDGGVFALSTEGGYAFQFDWLTVEPTLGLNYAHLWQDSFNESGAAADGHNYGLNVNSVSMDSVRSVLGVRLAAQFGEQDSVQFLPAVHALWEHEFVDRYADVNESFIGGSGAFDVRGVELGADTAVLGGGLTVAFNKSVQAFVNYDANLNSQLSSSTISGGLSITW